MLEEYRSCDFYAILRSCAPSRVARKSLTNLARQDRGTPAELTLEGETVTQDDLHSVNLSSLGVKLDKQTTTHSETNHPQISGKPAFADYMLTYHEVVRYAEMCIRRVIPLRLWGSEANLRNILKCKQDLIFV